MEERGEERVEERVEERRRQTMSVRRHRPVPRVKTGVGRRKVELVKVARGKVQQLKGLRRRAEQPKVASVVGSSSRRSCACEGCKKKNCGICVFCKDMKRYFKKDVLIGFLKVFYQQLLSTSCAGMVGSTR